MSFHTTFLSVSVIVLLNGDIADPCRVVDDLNDDGLSFHIWLFLTDRMCNTSIMMEMRMSPENFFHKPTEAFCRACWRHSEKNPKSALAVIFS